MLKSKLFGKDANSKKQIENIIFFIVILIATILIINVLTNDKSANEQSNSNNSINTKTLADNYQDNNSSLNLEKNLEEILQTVKGVGEVKVFVNYSESSKSVAMYDENTKTSSTEENDDAGGVRTITQTDTQKNIVFSEQNGDKEPITEKIVLPTIQGAVITAKGASDSIVKTNIVNAVQAATGLTIDKIQVFEMK